TVIHVRGPSSDPVRPPLPPVGSCRARRRRAGGRRPGPATGGSSSPTPRRASRPPARTTRSWSSPGADRARLRLPPHDEEPTMITGAHVILYSADADADRAFLRDLLGTRTVDAGGGWT